jgi:hypothetical protein
MKLSVIFELLLILIIVAYGAYGKPLEKGIKAQSRQEPAVAAGADVTTAKPATDDDDDIDILSLLAGDDDDDDDEEDEDIDLLGALAG